MKKLFLSCFLCAISALIDTEQAIDQIVIDEIINIVQTANEQADVLHDIDDLILTFFDFITTQSIDVNEIEQFKAAYLEHQISHNDALNKALSILKTVNVDNAQAAELYNTIENMRKRAVFVGLTVFDRLTVYGQSIFNDSVYINGSQLPANQPALSVTGTTLLSSLFINSLGNIYGNSPASPIQYVVINANGTLGSVPSIGSSGTVTSVNGSSNITVINPTTTPVVSLNPNISITSASATGSISANSVTTNSATINNSVTVPSVTISGAAGDVGDIFTIGTGGLLSPIALVAGPGITITPSTSTITIASTPLTIQCDTGSAIENNNTLTFTGSASGNTVAFSGSGSTVTLNVSDSNFNTALGAGASATGIGTGGSNTAIGANAHASGGSSVAIGYNASATGPFSIAIGANETAGSSVLSIGTQAAPSQCYIGGIYGVTGTGNTVLVTSNNQLVAPSSSRRYKENIAPLPHITDKVMLLNPVSFSYTKDEDHAKHLGFIAQEVEPLFPEMIVRDKQGNTDSVCSQFFIPVVVKTVQEHQNSIVALSDDFKQLSTDIQELKKLTALLIINNKK